MMEDLDINDRLIRLGQHLDDERAALAARKSAAMHETLDIAPSPQVAQWDPLGSRAGADPTVPDHITIESTTKLNRQPTRFRWVAVAAASLVFVAGVLFVVRQPPETGIAAQPSVDAAGEVDGSMFGWPDASVGDLIVWVRGTADEAAIAALDQQIATISDVASYRYVSPDDTYARFVASTLDDPALAASVSATDVGGYFHIVTSTPEAIEAALGDAASVTFVEVIGDRLYLLPPSDTPFGEETFSYTDLEVPNVDEGSAVVVARETETGYDQIVLIAHLISGSTFDDGVPDTIGGVEVLSPPYNSDTIGRKLDDGTWLEFYSAADGTVLADVISGTSVIDNLIRFQPSDGGPAEVGRIDDISGGRRTAILSNFAGQTPPDPHVYFHLRTSVDDGDIPLLSPFADSMEAISVRGQEGAVVNFLPTADQPGRIAIKWRETPGFAVELAMSGTTEEILNLAERLRPVNASVWRAINHLDHNDIDCQAFCVRDSDS